jgi:hypothetical protein
MAAWAGVHAQRGDGATERRRDSSGFGRVASTHTRKRSVPGLYNHDDVIGRLATPTTTMLTMTMTMMMTMMPAALDVVR